MPNDISESLQLAQARDTIEITRLLHTMCQTMDRNQVAEWLGCFAPGGGWTYWATGSDRPVFDLHGEDELRAFIQQHAVRNADYGLKHLIANTCVTVDTDSAVAVSYYFTHSRDADGMPTTRTSGRYTDRLARGADGRWRLEQRTVHLDMGPTPVPLEGR